MPGAPDAARPAGDGLRAGAAHGGPAQGGRGVGDARLGGGAGRARSQDRLDEQVVEPHARHPAEGSRRHRVDARRAGRRAGRPRPRPGASRRRAATADATRRQPAAVRQGTAVARRRRARRRRRSTPSPRWSTSDSEQRDDVRDALRAVLVNRREDLARFDRAVRSVLARLAGGETPTCRGRFSRRGVAVTKVQWLGAASVPPEEHGGERAAGRARHRPDLQRGRRRGATKDFAAYDAADIARARAVIAAWRGRPASG